MKIFKNLFSETKEYIQDFFKASREQWLARISAWIAFFSLILFLIFVWKNIQPDFVKDLPKFANRFVRYFVFLVVFLIVFFTSFQILKFLFLDKKSSQH